MMEKKLDAKEARVQIWEELLRVAKPDSKFSWQFSEFICDYEGSEKGTAISTLSTRCSRPSGCAMKRPRLSAQGMMCRWWMSM